jgi:hypothetical protein
MQMTNDKHSLGIITECLGGGVGTPASYTRGWSSNIDKEKMRGFLQFLQESQVTIRFNFLNMK